MQKRVDPVYRYVFTFADYSVSTTKDYFVI